MNTMLYVIGRLPWMIHKSQTLLSDLYRCLSSFLVVKTDIPWTLRIWYVSSMYIVYTALADCSFAGN